MLAAAVLCCVAAVEAPARAVGPRAQDPAQRPPPGQTQPQDPQPPAIPPGARVDIGDVVLERAVQAMQGKPVRAIQVQRPDAESNTMRMLDQASTDSFVRSLQTRVGQPFEARKVSEDCNSLWRDLRTVVQAWVQEIDGEVVVTFVVEREVTTYASVEFVGLNHLERFDVDSLLGLTADRQVTETEAEAMRKVLIARYRRDGYAFCSVTLDKRPVPDLPAAPVAPGPRQSRPDHYVRFVVDEGPKVTVGTVTFIGNATFPADPVFGMFGTGAYLLRDARITSEPSRGLFNGGAYSEELIQEDLDRLRIFYRSRGFLDATVDQAAPEFTPDRSEVDLTFVVVEGQRYKIRSVRVQHVDEARQPITTAPLYPPEEIQKELKVQPGEHYDHERLQRDMRAIQDFYGRRGHPPKGFPGMTNVEKGCVVFSPREVYGLAPEVDLEFQVCEGTPKRLRDVVIRGNRFTRDHVIRRRIRVMPGDRIDMVEVNRSLRAIEQSRYFQDPASLSGPRLQLEPVAGQPDVVDIGLDVEDGPTGQLRWGIGVSTGEGVQGSLSFDKRNFDLSKLPSSPDPITAIGEVLDNRAFHGGGQQLSMLLAPGSEKSQFQITWTDPDIFRQYFDTHELRVSGRRVIRRLPDGYTSDILGADVGLTRNFTEHFQASVFGRIESVEVDDLAPDATSLAFDAEGQTELRGIRGVLRYVDFDDRFRPTSGFEASLSTEMIGGPLGGEESLTKLIHLAHVYVPVSQNEMGHRTVFHVEQMFGWARAFGGSDDVFLTERFYMGGPNLRGFDFRRAGPKEFDRPTGGEAMYTASVEMYFPLIATRLEGDIRDREIVRFLVFNDFGLLGLEIEDPTFRELRAAIGVGVRVEIPLLDIPIAIDVGWPWLYEDTDTRRQLYFSISR